MPLNTTQVSSVRKAFIRIEKIPNKIGTCVRIFPFVHSSFAVVLLVVLLRSGDVMDILREYCSMPLICAHLVRHCDSLERTLCANVKHTKHSNNANNNSKFNRLGLFRIRQVSSIESHIIHCSHELLCQQFYVIVFYRWMLKVFSIAKIRRSF